MSSKMFSKACKWALKQDTDYNYLHIHCSVDIIIYLEIGDVANLLQKWAAEVSISQQTIADDRNITEKPNNSQVMAKKNNENNVANSRIDGAIISINRPTQMTEKTSINLLWIRNWWTLLHRCCMCTKFHPECTKSYKNQTLSIDAYLLEEQSCQISSRSEWNDRALGFFEEVAPTRTTRRTRRVAKLAMWDQFLIWKLINK